MTTQGGKHTRKNSDNGRVQKKKERHFRLGNMTTEIFEHFLQQEKSRDGDEEKG